MTLMNSLLDGEIFVKQYIPNDNDDNNEYFTHSLGT